MSVVPTVDHYDWKGTLFYTEFRGERQDLAKSEFLRPLLPPEDRRHIRFHRHEYADSHQGCSSVVSANLKHGGVCVRVWWEREGFGTDANPLPRDAIIGLARRILCEATGRPLSLVNWPFPLGGIAA